MASSVQQDFITQIYVAILSYSSWFYVASYIQLDSVIGYFHTALGFFPMAPGSCDRILNSVISYISSRISMQVYGIVGDPSIKSYIHMFVLLMIAIHQL